jgi:glycosyltransferase involved in cell wall biosynthesis
MPSGPLVSILIPCFNAARWLRDTIESAGAQTWANKEIIIVDDGSTDNSLAIAREYESPQIVVVRQQNLGASAARNFSLRLAQGDYCQFLDADDILDPNKIRIQIERLLKFDGEFIASGEWARFHDQVAEAAFVPEPVWADAEPLELLKRSWLGGGMMPIFAWLVPRSLMARVGPWNETLTVNDDGEYFTRVVLGSRGVLFCPGAKGYYRSGLRRSLSNLLSPQGHLSVFKSCQLCSEQVLQRANTAETRSACASLFQRFVFSAYPDVPELVQAAEKQIQLLGGGPIGPSGGNAFRATARLAGWKAARRVQRLFGFRSESNIK